MTTFLVKPLDLPYYAFYGLFTVNNIPTKFETTNEEIVRKILPEFLYGLET